MKQTQTQRVPSSGDEPQATEPVHAARSGSGGSGRAGSGLGSSRLMGVGILGANLFGLLGLAAFLTGAIGPAAIGAQNTIVQDGATQVPVTPSFATSDSNDRMIAVTGVDVTGASVLYLIDTINMQLACYQATGGAKSTQNVRLIGARRIDLDLQLIGFHDESDLSYSDLERQFEDIPVEENSGR